MWELDCEEGWAPKNWCFWTVVLEKTLESPLDCKEIQPVQSEGDQPWDFFGRNDAEAETPVLWAPHAKSWLIGKDSDAGRDWGQEEKGMTEDEMEMNWTELNWRCLVSSDISTFLHSLLHMQLKSSLKIAKLLAHSVSPSQVFRQECT